MVLGYALGVACRLARQVLQTAEHRTRAAVQKLAGHLIISEAVYDHPHHLVKGRGRGRQRAGLLAPVCHLHLCQQKATQEQQQASKLGKCEQSRPEGHQS